MTDIIETPDPIAEAVARVVTLDKCWRDLEVEARVAAHMRIRAMRHAIETGATITMIADALDVHSTVIVQLCEPVGVGR
jgi:hypothetical protein